MPKIPRVESPTVQTQITQQPKARSVDVSSGLSQLGQTIGQVSQIPAEIKFKRDTTSAESAMLAFDNAKNEALFNPTSGYYNTQGRSAVDGADGARKTINDLMQQHLDGLDNPEAQKMFKKAADARMVRDNLSITRHSAKGQQVWELSTSKAQESNAIKNASLYYNNEKELATYMSLGELAIHDRKDLVGQEQTTRNLEAFRSGFVKQAVTGALSNKDITKAEELLDKYGSLLEGNDLVTVNNKINTEREKQTTTATVAQIYEPGKPLNEMLTEARAVENADVRKEVERQIKNMNSADKVAEQETVNNIINTRDQQLSSGELFYRDMSQEELDAIGPKGRDLLKQAEEEYATGKEVITDYFKYTELMSLPTPDLAKINPTDHYSYLGKSERNKLNNAVIAARKGGKDDESTRVQTNSAQTKQVIEQLLGRAVNKKKDTEFVNEFYGLVADQVDAAELQKGSKLTNQEFRTILDNFTRTAVTEGWIFDSEENLTEIPPEHLDTLASELRRRNIAVTSENMIKVYQASVKAGIL
jgi:hypothetical protein